MTSGYPPSKILTLAFFFTISALYLFFCPKWFFDGEDWGLIFKVAQWASWRDVLYGLYKGSVIHLSLPMAHSELPPIADQTFFSIYYRPMVLLVHFIQYHLFGLHAYAYFMFIITLHAANASLLLYWLLAHTHVVIALIASLFFAFHPTLHSWLGKIDTQQHQLALLLMMCTALCLRQHKKRYTFLACFFFFLSLLTRETFIVVPWAILLWQSFKRKRHVIHQAFLLCTVSIAYLLLRGAAYPPVFSNVHAPLNFSLLLAIKSHCCTSLHFLYDLFWLQWFPWTTYDYCKALNILGYYKIIKLFIVFLVAACFITNARKNVIVLLGCCALILYWPLLFTPYGGLRFFYESLPLHALALAYLLHYAKIMTYKSVRLITYILISSIILCNAYSVIKSMNTIMKDPKKINAAINTLKSEAGNKLINSPLLILNAHKQLHAIGIIQALQLHGISRRLSHYFYRNVAIRCNPGRSFDSHHLNFKVEKSSILIQSHDPLAARFEPINVEPHPCYLTGEAAECSKTSINLIFNEKYFDKHFKVLVWMFNEERFFMPIDPQLLSKHQSSLQQPAR